ncbi:MAG: hypothetical protein WCA08_25325, partial [Desulfoferrobacter sp.]
KIQPHQIDHVLSYGKFAFSTLQYSKSFPPRKSYLDVAPPFGAAYAGRAEALRRKVSHRSLIVPVRKPAFPSNENHITNDNRILKLYQQPPQALIVSPAAFVVSSTVHGTGFLGGYPRILLLLAVNLTDFSLSYAPSEMTL